MEIEDAVRSLEEHVPNPKEGLPNEVFYYISRTTPLINVDLLIKDELGRTLLTWRGDQYAGMGWHIPGGIIRFKETWEQRIQKVAETEIGSPIEFDPAPIAINQIFAERDTRGHFISLLFRCSLPSSFIPDNKGLTEKDPGYIKWHTECPDNFLACQSIYRNYF